MPPTLQVTAHRSSIQTRWVKCRKVGCHKCPHGPYLYRVWREGKTVKTEYLGKLPVVPAEPNGAAHPFKTGTMVRFQAAKTPYWILVVGDRRQVFDTRPAMKVEAVGWTCLMPGSPMVPYVTLVTLDGAPVHHPYDLTFSGPDGARRLDRRFPTSLLEAV